MEWSDGDSVHQDTTVILPQVFCVVDPESRAVLHCEKDMSCSIH
jgi:hypothetical protein